MSDSRRFFRYLNTNVRQVLGSSLPPPPPPGADALSFKEAALGLVVSRINWRLWSLDNSGLDGDSFPCSTRISYFSVTCNLKSSEWGQLLGNLMIEVINEKCSYFCSRRNGGITALLYFCVSVSRCSCSEFINSWIIKWGFSFGKWNGKLGE